MGVWQEYSIAFCPVAQLFLYNFLVPPMRVTSIIFIGFCVHDRTKVRVEVVILGSLPVVISGFGAGELGDGKKAKAAPPAAKATNVATASLVLVTLCVFVLVWVRIVIKFKLRGARYRPGVLNYKNYQLHPVGRGWLCVGVWGL